ncbi:MAG: hypothetical protein C4527_03660 [Candidatus Omnitrophota bacterium]|nr:MAG: hypothetical protein C4527_03660 [Candidatus Omnitrophota bacterium]
MSTIPSLQENRNAKAIKLLDEWLSDQSGYDENVWPKLKKLIEVHRLSARKQFWESSVLRLVFRVWH